MLPARFPTGTAAVVALRGEMNRSAAAAFPALRPQERVRSLTQAGGRGGAPRATGCQAACKTCARILSPDPSPLWALALFTPGSPPV
ncbi:hypothetical protein MRX96_000275 [Rhipicephalus microplus]